MAKTLGSLLFRGILGVMSIAATAVITVLVQRYLYEKTGTPALMLAPPTSSSPNPAQPQPGESSAPAILVNPAGSSDPESSDPFSNSRVDAPTGTETEAEQEQQGDRNKIMEQFWDKLNH